MPGDVCGTCTTITTTEHRGDGRHDTGKQLIDWQHDLVGEKLPNGNSIGEDGEGLIDCETAEETAEDCDNILILINYIIDPNIYILNLCTRVRACACVHACVRTHVCV